MHFNGWRWQAGTARRLAGPLWRTAAGAGTLRDTRGLLGLTVLSLGLVLKVASPALSARMALPTGPALHPLTARPAAARTTVW
jgi:hypothetical protein